MKKKNVLYKFIVLLLIFASVITLISCSPQLKPSPNTAQKEEENVIVSSSGVNFVEAN